MSKKLRALAALFCAVAILASCLPVFAEDGLSDTESVLSAAEDDVRSGDVTVIVCSEIPLFMEDTRIGSGVAIDGATYVPLVAFLEFMMGETACSLWDQDSGSASITVGELTVQLSVNDKFMVANGRYVYFDSGVYNVGGSLMVPLRAIARVLDLGVAWNDDDWSVDIDASAMALPVSGDEFYDEEELYWLSHVIYSESGNQPLEGMIGVGNVVLNRKNDESGNFPDTVKGVIFQSGQFDVVRNGSIYLEPNDMSIVAAKLCLEGYNTVENSLFFLNPKTGSSSWFKKNRVFCVSIQDHDFYA